MNIIRKTPDVTPPIKEIEIKCYAAPADTMKIDQIVRSARSRAIEPGCRFIMTVESQVSTIYVTREDAIALAAALNEIFG